DTVLPAAGAEMETVGGVVSLFTVTETAVEVVVLPAASRARAVKVWEPLLSPVVFRGTGYGLAGCPAPQALPSRQNCTPATPTLSAALPETVTAPDTVEPLAGPVTETVGAPVSVTAVVMSVLMALPLSAVL